MGELLCRPRTDDTRRRVVPKTLDPVTVGKGLNPGWKNSIRPGQNWCDRFTPRPYTDQKVNSNKSKVKQRTELSILEQNQNQQKVGRKKILKTKPDQDKNRNTTELGQIKCMKNVKKEKNKIRREEMSEPE